MRVERLRKCLWSPVKRHGVRGVSQLLLRKLFTLQFIQAIGGFVLFKPIVVWALSHEAHVWHYIHDDSGATVVPETALLDLTYKCNLRCLMCPQALDLGMENSKIRENYPASKLLDLPEWKTVIDKLQEAGLKSVILSGGEPFLLPYTLDLIDYINSRKLNIFIITNGTLITTQIADFLVQRSVRGISISIDGPKEVHNRIRQKPHAYERAIEGLELLIAAKQKHQNNDLELSINCTLSAMNYTTIEKLPAIAKKYNVTLSIGMLQFFPSDPESNSRASNLTKGECRSLPSALYSIDSESLKISLKRFRGAARDLNYSFLTSPPHLSDQEIVKWYTDMEYQYSSKCLAPWKFLNIDPSGRLVMCMLGNCVGNVLENPIIDVLNSEEYKAFRRSLRRRGVFTWCTRCCLLNDRSWTHIPNLSQGGHF